jgi:hypothetical protein
MGCPGANQAVTPPRCGESSAVAGSHSLSSPPFIGGDFRSRPGRRGPLARGFFGSKRSAPGRKSRPLECGVRERKGEIARVTLCPDAPAVLARDEGGATGHIAGRPNSPAPFDALTLRQASPRHRGRYWTEAVQGLRLLSMNEAALAARCHRSEIQRRMALGLLPFIQRSSRRYIRQEDLQEMLENETQVSQESVRRGPGRHGRRAKMKPGEIDPRLREFFD